MQLAGLRKDIFSLFYFPEFVHLVMENNIIFGMIIMI